MPQTKLIMSPYLKIKRKAEKSRGAAQVAESLPSKCEALSSVPKTTEKKWN
jgi:hypothetical protein